jgi:hypothetical protein
MSDDLFKTVLLNPTKGYLSGRDPVLRAPGGLFDDLTSMAYIFSNPNLTNRAGFANPRQIVEAEIQKIGKFNTHLYLQMRLSDAVASILSARANDAEWAPLVPQLITVLPDANFHAYVHTLFSNPQVRISKESTESLIKRMAHLQLKARRAELGDQLISDVFSRPEAAGWTETMKQFINAAPPYVLDEFIAKVMSRNDLKDPEDLARSLIVKMASEKGLGQYAIAAKLALNVFPRARTSSWDESIKLFIHAAPVEGLRSFLYRTLPTFTLENGESALVETIQELSRKATRDSPWKSEAANILDDPRASQWGLARKTLIMASSGADREKLKNKWPQDVPKAQEQIARNIKLVCPGGVAGMLKSTLGL